MKTGIKNFITRVKYFCATQKASFYIGMVFAVLSIIALSAHISLTASALLTPLATIGLYLIVRLDKQTPKELRDNGEIMSGILAAILGCIWVLLFVLI